MPQPARPSAYEQLLEHRVKALEESTVNARQVERDVDHLKLLATHIESSLARFEAATRERDEHHGRSLERLHERVDEALQAVRDEQQATRAEVVELKTAKAREDGARDERRRMWTSVPVLASATVALGAFVVALLTLIL
jgi:hypothetical protein